MVQVFGNRIIGGIGAPDSRAAEAFGAGVSTTLGQRNTRQAMDERAQSMRLRDVDLQWATEDRGEAKRRRAAAEAAAGAARARSDAMAARYRDIIGAPGAQPPVAGLNVPAGVTTRSAAPAAPARPAGVRAPASPPLSFGPAVTGAGVAEGERVSAAFPEVTNVELVQGTYDRPTQSRFRRVAPPETTGPLPSYVEPPGLWTGVAGDLPGAASADTLLQQGLINDYEYTQLVRGSRAQQYEVLANVGRRRSGRDVPFFVPGATPAGTDADTDVAAAPAGADVPPEVAVTLPGGEQLMLSTGQPVPVQPVQLTFGPQLGAMPRTQEDVFVDTLLAQTGQVRAEPLPPPPPMGEPGAPNRAVTRLLTERDRQLQLAQAALEFNDMQTYEAAAAKIMELDVALEAGVARMAINEARYSNAPQRLNAIWTDLTGMQYEFVPSAPGVYDTYVNGELFQQSVPVEMIAEETLMLADANYAQQQAALAQIRQEALAKGMGQAEANVFEYGQKAAIDAQKALMVGLTEIDLLAMKRDLGVGEQDQIDFQKDDTTGMILVFRNGEPAGQYAPITENDATGNPVTRYQRVQ